MRRFVKVVFNLNIDRELIYYVPDFISEKSHSLLFKRVFAPLKNKIQIGFVVEEFEDRKENYEFKIEEIIDVIDKKEIINRKEYEFYKWMSDYYVVPLGQIIFNALPSFKLDYLKVKLKKEAENLEDEQKQIVELIKKGYSLKKIQKNIPYFFVHLNSLIDKGIVEISSKRYRVLKKDFDLKEFDVSYRYFRPERLNEFQQSVWDRLKNFITDRFSVHLIFGITGSGKTEIYLRAIEKVLNTGRKVIYLVPEIALTPNFAEIFIQNFPDKKIGVIHSKITEARRNKLWEEIIDGNIDIVIGARSAIFAPFKDLGLIIVDEEHETSYKQEEKPRYNARDCAVVKGKIYKIPVILGSATPSVKSWYNAQIKKYYYYEILYRANLNPLPEIEIVDLKKEKGDRIISERLNNEIKRAISEKGQVILFLNKKGYASYLFCKNCGYVFKCKNCDISLTYFKARNSLYCPYCETYYKVQFTCPECDSPYLQLSGKGTEKIEEKVQQELGNIKVARFDLESTSRKGEIVKILKEFNEGKIDVIVGTQMIAKGHDFKNVNLVGIITVDNILNFPDYTSSERAFQLLVQCSGRAGRDKKRGRVIVQTYNPENYVFKFFENYDFKGFYENELFFRKTAKYPPFYNICHLIFESNSYDKAKKVAKEVFEKINFNGIIKLGPAESPIRKIRNKYRFSILLKSKSKAKINSAVKFILSLKIPYGVDIKVDIDPENIT